MKKKVIIAAIAAAAVCSGSAFGRTADQRTLSVQNIHIFNAIYKELQANYVDSIDAGETMRVAIDAMLASIDPYTEYFSGDELDEFNSISSGEFSGIGSIIMQRNGHIELSSPQWGAPARLAGVRHGDILIAIDGDTLPQGYSTAETSARLRGQAGTKVTLTVKRPYADTDSMFDIEIVRGTIRTNPVPYYGMINDHTGYIALTTFNEKSAADVRHALLELKKDPRFNSLVIDLRDNGGGLLESAVQIAGFFVPKGTEIVRTRYRDKDREKTYLTTQQPIDTEIPLAILVNGNTASAAEILSGSMQDLDRAVVIGSRTYGKGLVQSSRPLPFEGVLKVTVARYYIPSGRLIQAIDYSHRNEDGSVARIPDSLTNEFSTRAGRIVRDGGGITPDITVQQPKINRLIYNIYADNWAYDYANRFAARQQQHMPDATDFVVGDSIFTDFKAFIDPAKFKYDNLCETGLSLLREAAETEGYMTDSVASYFDELEKMLKHNLDQDLDFNRKQITEILDSELSERFYNEADCHMRQLRYDTDLEEALKMLDDTGSGPAPVPFARYRAILSPKK